MVQSVRYSFRAVCLLACFMTACIVYFSKHMRSAYEDRAKKDVIIPLISVACTHDVLRYIPRMLKSIDVNVEHIQVYIGNSNSSVREIIKSSINETVVNYPRFLQGHVTVHESASNLGCASGWNLGLRFMRDSNISWGIIATSDIYFRPDSLSRIYANMAKLYRPGIAFINMDLLASWAIFIMTSELVANVGLFDENIYPMFHEDDDYAVRVRLSGAKVSRFTDVKVGHGQFRDGSKRYISGTVEFLRSEYEAPQKLYDFDKAPFTKMVERGQEANPAYIQQKWGNISECKYPHLMETCDVEYSTPFNCRGTSIKEWSILQRRMRYILTGKGTLTSALHKDSATVKKICNSSMARERAMLTRVAGGGQDS